MEFILMVVVFAAVFLFLPRLLKKPISSERDTADAENPILKETGNDMLQTKSDALEKQ